MSIAERRAASDRSINIHEGEQVTMSDFANRQARTSHTHGASDTVAPVPGRRTMVEQGYAASAILPQQTIESRDTEFHAPVMRTAAASALPHGHRVQRLFGRPEELSPQAA